MTACIGHLVHGIDERRDQDCPFPLIQLFCPIFSLDILSDETDFSAVLLTEKCIAKGLRHIIRLQFFICQLVIGTDHHGQVVFIHLVSRQKSDMGQVIAVQSIICNDLHPVHEMISYNSCPREDIQHRMGIGAVFGNGFINEIQ